MLSHTVLLHPDWEEAVLRLAEERVKHFQKLIEELRGSSAK